MPWTIRTAVIFTIYHDDPDSSDQVGSPPPSNGEYIADTVLGGYFVALPPPNAEGEYSLVLHGGWKSRPPSEHEIKQGSVLTSFMGEVVVLSHDADPDDPGTPRQHRVILHGHPATWWAPQITFAVNDDSSTTFG